VQNAPHSLSTLWRENVVYFAKKKGCITHPFTSSKSQPVLQRRFYAQKVRLCATISTTQKALSGTNLLTLFAKLLQHFLCVFQQLVLYVCQNVHKILRIFCVLCFCARQTFIYNFANLFVNFLNCWNVYFQQVYNFFLVSLLSKKVCDCFPNRQKH